MSVLTPPAPSQLEAAQHLLCVRATMRFTEVAGVNHMSTRGIVQYKSASSSPYLSG